MTRRRPRHPVQEQILQVLAQRPGACVQDLAEAVGLTRTATLHHLRRLNRDGLVRSVRQGRRLLHFLAAQQPPTLLGLLQVHTARLVVQGLLADPKVSWRRLARQLGITPRAVRWHVRKLEAEGALQVHRTLRGPGHVVLLRDDLRQLVGLGPPSLPAPEHTVFYEVLTMP